MKSLCKNHLEHVG